MKYIILIGDGMADYPLKELNNKTPLQVAKKPNMDKLALNGRSGLLKTVPDGMEPGSDVANLSIMGYDPAKYYTGRGPLEAASMGVKLSKNDVAFRCNMITEKEGVLDDFNAGHITSEESGELIKVLNENFKDTGTFYHGISYRNLFVYNEKESANLKTTPPHDIVGESISNHLIQPESDENSILLNKLMDDSQEVLMKTAVNQNRLKNGKKPANHIWLWGQGPAPQIDNFLDKYGLKGATITGVDLIKGIGVYLGLENIHVPGATGYLDTDYAQKGQYAINALNDFDIIFIHVEAPDEAGHSGDVKEKIKAIEEIDSKILGPLMEVLEDYDEYTVVLLPDHATPIDLRTHTMDAIPYVIFSTNLKPDSVEEYDEFSCKEGVLGVEMAYNLINNLIRK